MPDRIVLVGLGGIGSQLVPSLVRYLAFRPEPRPVLVLVDGDAYEPDNRTRQVFPESAAGTNKAEALAEAYRGGLTAGRSGWLLANATALKSVNSSCRPRVMSKSRLSAPFTRPCSAIPSFTALRARDWVASPACFGAPMTCDIRAMVPRVGESTIGTPSSAVSHASQSSLRGRFCATRRRRPIPAPPVCGTRTHTSPIRPRRRLLH